MVFALSEGPKGLHFGGTFGIITGSISAPFFGSPALGNFVGKVKMTFHLN